MRELLAPKPFRGDQVAAGAVVLSVLVLLLNVRMGTWSSGVHLVYTLAAVALVLGMSVAAPNDPAGPPAWHATLYVAGYLLALATLARAADVLGSDGGPGTVVWVGALLCALTGWMSRARGSASGTLLLALTAVVTSLGALDWIVAPDGLSAYRHLLLFDVAVLTLCALWQRIRGPAHGVQLLNATGLTLLAVAATFAFAAFGFVLVGRDEGDVGPDIAWTWSVLLLAGGIGILSAGAADRERGNVLVGILVLLAFVGISAEGDLLGWPIPLAGAAVVLLVIGLRPSTPLPTEPPPGAGGAPPADPLPVQPLR